MKHKRGDYSPCGTLRFWSYLSYVRKDGRHSERWIPAHNFENYKKQVTERDRIGEARTDFIRNKRMIPKVDPKEYVWKTYGIK